MTPSNRKYLPIITGTFVAALLIANTLDTKIFMLAGLALPAGIILFPLTYLYGDILTEIYGYAATRKVIWTGFASLGMMVLCYELAGLIPPAPFWTDQEAYETILGRVPRIALASITAYFMGSFCNSYVLAKLKVRMRGRTMPWRFVASTAVGQAVDTVVFVLVAFVGVFPTSELLPITVASWGFKVGWEIVALPATVRIVARMKRAEGLDHFDRDTDFNPFRLDESSDRKGTTT